MIVAILYELDESIEIISLSTEFEVSLDVENFNKNYDTSSFSINDKHNGLTVYKPDHAISTSSLYGDHITDLKAIIGPNGTGKTTILRDIFKLEPNVKGRTVYIIYKHNIENQFIFYSSKNYSLNEGGDTNTLINLVNSEPIYYYSNTLEPFIIDKHNGNLSTTYLISKHSYNGLMNSDMNKQLNFLFPFSDKEPNFIDTSIDTLINFSNLINLDNKKIELSLSFQGESILKSRGIFSNDSSLYNNLNFKTIFGSYYDQISEKHKDINSRRVNGNLKKAITIQYLSILSHKYNLLNDQKINKFSTDELSLFFSYHIHDFKKSEDGTKEVLRNAYLNMLDSIDSFADLLSLKGLINKIKSIDFDNKNRLTQQIYEEYKSLFDIVKYFNSENNDIVELVSILTLKWEGLSYGEYNLLNIFGRIKDQLRFSESQNHILLLDEIDLALHPEWQLNWLNNLIMGLRSFDNNFQIILTTHSPLLLSDIPKRNIVFLSHYKVPSDSKLSLVNDLEISETFAQNVQTLFYDNFFLKKTIGKIASKKIDEIDTSIKRLESMLDKKKNSTNSNASSLSLFSKDQRSSFEKQISDIQNLINMIGDPLYKNILTNDLMNVVSRYAQDSNQSTFETNDFIIKIERKNKND